MWNDEEDYEETSYMIEIKRRTYTQLAFDHTYQSTKETQTPSNRIKHFLSSFTHINAKSQLYKRIPAIKWIREYNFKKYPVPDLMSGIVVGIMNITQGLAYGILAGLAPEYGLYTALFGALVYWIFGTSPHITIGSYGPVSIMVASTIQKISEKYVPPVGFNGTLEGTSYLSADHEKAKVMIATTQCFWVGLIHVLLAIFQFSFISAYLSEPMLKGFVAGTAIHVCATQLVSMFGIKEANSQGYFKVSLIIYKLLVNIAKTNVASFLISLISFIILAAFKFKLNKMFQKLFIIPFPTEILVVILATIVTDYGKLNEKYKVSCVGEIPVGIPQPEVPPLGVIQDIILDTIIISLISFAINFSCTDLVANKFKYKVNTTQELFASGVCNLFASFFASFTGSASLSRTLVQVSSGGKTQVVSFISSAILILVLYTLNGVFYYTPKAVIATIVFVALLSPIIKLKLLKFYWKAQFLITFVTIVIFDVDIGIIVGLGFYVFMNIARQTRPKAVVLGNIPGTEMYKNVRQYKDAREFDGIKIIRMEASLHYTNSKTFKKAIYRLSGVVPQDYLPTIQENKEDKHKEKTIYRILLDKITNLRNKKKSPESNNVKEQSDNDNHENSINSGEVIELDLKGEISNRPFDSKEFQFDFPIHTIIIDCSALNYVDSIGVKTLQQLINDYNLLNIKILLAECNDNVLDRFDSMSQAKGKNKVNFSKKNIYISVHDAVYETIRIHSS